MHRRSHNLLNCDMHSMNKMIFALRDQVVHTIIMRQISCLCAVVGNHRGWPQKLTEMPLDVAPGATDHSLGTNDFP